MSASENGHTGGHTPGPWTYTVEGNGENFRLMGGEVYIVVGCGCCGSPYMDGPHDANARLIAAAPTMLEALKQALLYIERDEVAHGRPFAAGNVVRAAISKAEGDAA